MASPSSHKRTAVLRAAQIAAAKTPLDRVGTFHPSAVGVDVEEVARFARLDRRRHSAFLQRVFSPQELAYCYSFSDPAPHLAARFAAKEAVFKAASALGIALGSMADVEIVRDGNIPRARISKLKNLDVSVSLSHSGHWALAFALVRDRQ